MGLLKRIYALMDVFAVELDDGELPPVTLVYMNGEERTMPDDEAIRELFIRGDIAAVHCENEAVKSFYDALLPGCNCAELWESGDDSHMHMSSEKTAPEPEEVAEDDQRRTGCPDPGGGEGQNTGAVGAGEEPCLE